jgi:hypothetical protein
MEDIRTYRIDEEETRRVNDQSNDRERSEYNASSDDEVPFHIPRD